MKHKLQSPRQSPRRQYIIKREHLFLEWAKAFAAVNRLAGMLKAEEILRASR